MLTQIASHHGLYRAVVFSVPFLHKSDIMLILKLLMKPNNNKLTISPHAVKCVNVYRNDDYVSVHKLFYPPSTSFFHHGV